MDSIQQAIDIRVDNSPEDLRKFIGATFVPVNFKTGIKVRDFWRESDKGVYLLITKSELEPEGVHVSVLRDGQLEHANRWLLAKALIGVHEVFQHKN